MKPTPLLLKYEKGDFNCLHQDVYGAVTFPFQVILALSAYDSDYRGGELLLVEQLPRAQSKGQAIVMEQGEAVVITTRYRPVRGARGMVSSECAARSESGARRAAIYFGGDISQCRIIWRRRGSIQSDAGKLCRTATRSRMGISSTAS